MYFYPMKQENQDKDTWLPETRRETRSSIRPARIDRAQEILVNRLAYNIESKGAVWVDGSGQIYRRWKDTAHLRKRAP